MSDGSGLLSGVRILDLTAGVAGPACTQLMAFLGADVIRVSSEAKRGFVQQDGNPTVHNLFLSKRSVRLNLQTRRGIELAYRLVALSDVVIENQRPGALEKLGLGYEQLRTVNPRVIAVSLTTSGYGGHEQYVGYAPQFAALSSVSTISGYPDGPPAEYVNWPDFVSGSWSAFGLLYALLERERTGSGQYIDVSAAEALTTLVPDVLMDAALNRRSQGRQGNDFGGAMPHDCYQCRDPGDWVSIAIMNDGEWRALSGVIGDPALDDARYATARSREEHRNDVDAFIAMWARGLGSDEVTARLQAVGVGAMPVFNGKRLFTDPNSRAQQRWVTVDHPILGLREVMGPPWSFSQTPTTVRVASVMGADESAVFGELLGLPASEIESLKDEGVIR